MPWPLNHSTKRLSIGFSMAGESAATVSGVAAEAVPSELNIETNGGRPTTIRAPAVVIPFNSDRRDVLTRSVIICDIQRQISSTWGVFSGLRIRELAQHY